MIVFPELDSIFFIFFQKSLSQISDKFSNTIGQICDKFAANYFMKLWHFCHELPKLLNYVLLILATRLGRWHITRSIS